MRTLANVFSVDHDEVWSVPWEVVSTTWENGAQKTSVRLKTSPVTTERTNELVENEFRPNHRLNNLNGQNLNNEKPPIIS